MPLSCMHDAASSQPCAPMHGTQSRMLYRTSMPAADGNRRLCTVAMTCECVLVVVCLHGLAFEMHANSAHGGRGGAPAAPPGTQQGMHAATSKWHALVPWRFSPHGFIK